MGSAWWESEHRGRAILSLTSGSSFKLLLLSFHYDLETTSSFRWERNHIFKIILFI